LRPSISSWQLPHLLNPTASRVALFYTHLICRWHIFLSWLVPRLWTQSSPTAPPLASKLPVVHRSSIAMSGSFPRCLCDRMYNCRPMYHSVGGLLALGAILAGGGALVIREKFSASQFWSDVVRWDYTLFQHIGELRSYLRRRPLIDEWAPKSNATPECCRR
jgi:acyl-CoA synthetase (AMP-forming)/AMP-acid ligase II